MLRLNLIFIFFWIIFLCAGQNQNNTVLLNLSKHQHERYRINKADAMEKALEKNFPLQYTSDSIFFEIQYLNQSGTPQYFVTHNAVSASTISTNQVYENGNAGLNLDGSGITVHQWDAGSVRSTHQEFDSRVSNGDAKPNHWHSTHVAGTIVAAGISDNAKGMAYNADLIAFDWDEFNAEMAEEASLGALISNHSYGWLRGWEGGDTWWGDPNISTEEDYSFGFYDESAQIWDSIVYYAPYFLIVKSAGNDRNDSGDGSYPDDGPYDCIDQLGIAKNNLVVAAVHDIPEGYSEPFDVVMTSFSSWGPADDGRIKPDISANGASLYSTNSGSDDDYRNASGTSMSTPSVAGSAALLQQHYQELNGEFMKASTIKALIIHTADETGNDDGPDYEFGWGLMNTMNAALKISENDSVSVIKEESLTGSDSLKISFTSSASNSFRVTIAWTDPPGIPPVPSLDPADTILVNDMDLKIIDETNSTIYYPWKLDKDNPSTAATNNTKNFVDNVEMVIVPQSDSGNVYTVVVSHEGELHNDYQDFSLVLSYSGEILLPPEPEFMADNTTPTLSDTVTFTDLSANNPDSWLWSFEPESVTFLDGTDANSQNPKVKFNATGSYNVTLNCTNPAGESSITELNYINVFELLSVMLEVVPDEICFGDSAQLSVSVSGGTGNYSFEWTSEPPGFYSTEQNPTVVPDTTTIYVLEISDGMKSITDNILMIVHELPEITFVDWPELLCNENEPPVQLIALPEGGIYTGVAVSEDGIFSAESAPMGWNVIDYLFTDEFECPNVKIDSIFVDECVEIGEQQNLHSSIKIYPNPNLGSFIIQSQYIIDEFILTDQFGVEVFHDYPKHNRASIDVTVPKGIYIAKIILAPKKGKQAIFKSISIQ